MSTPRGDGWSGQRLDDADFSYARLHGPNFEGVKITDAWFANADISGFIGGLRINGVLIAPLVTAELDRVFPERILLRADDAKGLAEAWALIEGDLGRHCFTGANPARGAAVGTGRR